MNTDFNEAVHYISPLESRRNSTTQPLLQCTLDDISSVPSFRVILEEIVLLVNRSLPMVFAYVLQNSLSLSTVFVLGRLGSKELAAAALGNMFAAVTGWSVGMGLMTAMDTLCSQAYSSENTRHLTSIYLQRGILISTVLFVPVSILWSFSYQILIVLKVNKEIASLCQLYLKYLIPGILPLFYFECLKKFLQAQAIMNAPTYILLISSPINIIIMYSFVYKEPFTLGFVGAPLAVSFTQFIMLGLCLLYIKFIRGSEIWTGWSSRAFDGWKNFMQLGLPGIIMICAEWSAFEIMGLAASYFGTTSLATHSVIMTITNLFYMVPLGVGIAASNRLGNLLGESKPNHCKLSAYCSLVISSLFALINTLILIIFKSSFATFFTNDKKVIKMVIKVLPIAATFQLFDGFTAVSSGLLRGQGRQNLGAILNIIAYYLFALPIGLVLAFKLNLGIVGLWYGLCLALFTTSACLLFITAKTDWREQVDNTTERFIGA